MLDVWITWKCCTGHVTRRYSNDGQSSGYIWMVTTPSNDGFAGHVIRLELLKTLITSMNAFQVTQGNQQSSRLLFIWHENAVQVRFIKVAKAKHSDSLLTTKICNAVTNRITKHPRKTVRFVEADTSLICLSTLQWTNENDSRR